MNDWTTAELPADKLVIGTCSLCGGRVTIFQFWASSEVQVAICERCGARERKPEHGPIIDMVPKP
jgi:Zn ribbon nucleic-acid-binding protein